MEELLQELKKALEEERRAEVEKMEEEMRNISGKEREKRGRAILHLKGRIIGEEFGYKIVKFKREKEIDSEIVSGDSVLLSNGDPLRGVGGTVMETGSSHIVVATESPSFTRIDLSVNDVTFRRMQENLENLSEEGVSVLQYFLGEKKPSSFKRVDFSSLDGDLNEKQRKAVSCALGARDFFLLHGPFGTGKTKTTAEIILQEVEKGNKVLATAESNVAVDNLVEEIYNKAQIVRLGHPARVSNKLKKVTLSFLLESDKEYSSVKKLRKMGESAVEEQKNYTKPTLPKKKVMELSYFKKGKGSVSVKEMESMAKWISLNEKADGYYEGARAVEDVISRRILQKSQVVLSTNSSSVLTEEDFDIVVVDEASQTTVPSVLLPLSKAPRFVLAGDHKQLPPTVSSKEAQMLKHTLFEELMERFPQQSSLLDIQYRMNETLMRFPSEQFYEGKLKAFFKDISLRDLGVEDDNPLLFIDTSKLEDCFESRKKDSFSIHNMREAVLVKEVFEDLLKKGVQKDQIGIITPYEDQVEVIKNMCKTEVHTVDGYQGQEREVMILSFVRSNRKRELGFLRDMRRLNVSLTRAKRKLVLIGDKETLSSHKVYRRLIHALHTLLFLCLLL